VEVGIETVVWDHQEVEQKNKTDEISVDDGAVTGIQSIMEAASAVVSLSGVAMMITAAPVNAPEKSKAKKPLVHPKGKHQQLKRRNLHPQVMFRYFGYIFLNSVGTRLIMAQRVSPSQKIVQTMYLRIGSITSGRGTEIMHYRLHTRVS
jgi:hypothetical protein